MSVLFVNSENHSIETIAQKDPPFNPTLVEQCIKVLKIFLYYLFLPITYCFTLAAKSLLYVSVFPMTTYDSDLGRWIIKTFGGYKVDLIRVEESKKALNFMGAEQVEVHTVDGEKIQVMRMTQENFRNKIEALGGSFVDYQVELDSNNSKSYTVTEGKSCSHTLQVIEFSDSDPDILSNVQMSLQQLGLQEVDVKINNKQKTVFQFSLRSLVKDESTSNSRKVVIRCHPFVHYYSYEKKYLMNHLSMGLDVVFFDTRGLSKTTFTPSEEGVYIDADAVYKQVRDQWGYKGEDIWVTGRCSGTSQVSYLGHRYQNDGINLVLENGFEGLSQLVERQFWPLNWMGLSVIDSLGSSDEKTITEARNQHINSYVDQFNNIRKFKCMSKIDNDQSKVIIIGSDTDRFVGTKAFYTLSEEAEKTRTVFQLVHQSQNRNKDGHFEDVFLTDPKLYKEYSKIMSSNRFEYISNYL